MNEIIVNTITPGSQEWWYGIIVLGAMALFFMLLAPTNKHKQWKQWRRVLGWTIFIHQVFGIGLSIAIGRFTVENSLPLHMCNLSQILLFLHLAWDVPWALPVVTFWGPLGGIQAFLTPGMAEEITYFSMTRFYVAHGFVVIVPLYLLIRCGERLPRRVFGRVLAITTTVGVLLMGVNTALNSNYMYVNQPPPVNHPLVQGQWPEYLLVIYGAVLVLFYLFRRALNRYVE